MSKPCPSCNRWLKDLQSYCKDCGWQETIVTPKEGPPPQTLLREMDKYSQHEGETTQQWMQRLREIREELAGKLVQRIPGEDDAA
jgi:predicted amidophosphoribosyltransferase